MVDHSAFAKYIRAYCFGHATESEREAVETHLLECDHCWEEVRRLESSVRALQSERGLVGLLSAYDAATTFGISGKLDSFLAGHVWHVLIASILYASVYVVSLSMEFAYGFDRYSSALLKICPVVFFWMFVTSVAGMSISWKLASQWKGLGLSILAFMLSALLLHAGISSVLPDSPITLSSVPVLTAQAAYLKDTCYSLVLVTVFMILPFHFVVSMQQELKHRRYRYALEFLTGQKTRLAPRGALYPRHSLLVSVLVTMAVSSVFSANNLLGHIMPSPYMTLFTNLIYLRLILYYTLALECLTWYYRTLNELKYECRIAEAARLPTQT